jgi:4-alpha-glucanotransferase
VRRSGLIVPLFSIPSSSSWGIGDIGGITPLCAWLSGAGQRLLQLLPLSEMASGETSPYSAMSAMAIDPIYIALPRVAEFIAAGGESALPAGDRASIAHARAMPTIDYVTVRGVKDRALRAAFDRFVEHEWLRETPRARALRAFADAEAWWIDDYALFRALHAREQGRPWAEWPAALRLRLPAALDAARGELAHETLFYQYLQWLAGTQWQDARAAAAACGVALFGDLPFMVDTHSADVWTRQSQFRLDRSVGVPPDAFSTTGQDWGMPAYDWDASALDHFGWLRARARRSAALYDGYRIDHLVGFYRTYSRPSTGDPAVEGEFSPSEEADQLALGEQILGIFQRTGVDIIVEDLGVIPPFVRASLARLGLPGFRVFRWERDWDAAGEPFRDPATYPTRSVVTSGTHDTEPLITWWEAADKHERDAIANMPAVRRLAGDLDLTQAPYVPTVRDILLETLFDAASDTLLFPIQDVFGWHDRVNTPATVGPWNWTWRLRWDVDTLAEESTARERQSKLHDLAARYGRLLERK